MSVVNKLPFEDTNGIYLPGGEIKFWVRFPDKYTEEFTNNSGNSTTVNIAVPWDDAADFKNLAMGFTTGTAGQPTFYRTIPMRNPYASKQYLQSMRLVSQVATQDQMEELQKASPDPTLFPWAKDAAYDNWPTGGWVEYECTFTTMPYPILRDDEMPAAGSGVIQELSRYVRKTRRTIVQERRLPSYGFETCEVAPTVIPEVGFVPYTTEEIIYTIYQVPIALVPDVAISNCGACVNDATFDGKATETMLFKGLAAPLEPYGGPSGELYVNLMYNFGHNAQTWQSVPVNVDPSTKLPVYKRLRVTGSDTGTGTGSPLYGKADFSALFKPAA